MVEDIVDDDNMVRVICASQALQAYEHTVLFCTALFAVVIILLIYWPIPISFVTAITTSPQN